MRISDWSSDVCSSDLASSWQVDRALGNCREVRRTVAHWPGIGAYDPQGAERLWQECKSTYDAVRYETARVDRERGKPMAGSYGEWLQLWPYAILMIVIESWLLYQDRQSVVWGKSVVVRVA